MDEHKTESMCQKSMIYYYDCLSNRKEGIPDEILAHIERCDHCQQELQWLQQADAETGVSSKKDVGLTVQTAHMELHFALINQPVMCSMVKPYLPAMAIEGQMITISTPVTAHIRHCGSCAQDLTALRQMNLTTAQYGEVGQIFASDPSQLSQSLSDEQIKSIEEIRDRSDSGIVTCFRIKDAAQSGQQAAFDVEVSSAPIPSGQHSEGKPHLKVSVATPKPGWHFQLQSKRLVRPMVAAAAILIGTILLFRSSSVQATDISQIYEALKHVDTIMMTQYGTDSTTPLQQIWVSKALGVKLFKTQSRFVLWDLNRKIKQTLENTAVIESSSLDKMDIDAISKTMNIPWGLLPFKNTRELPKGAVWKKIELVQDDRTTESLEVYDLFWTEQTATYRWQYYIDTTTKRPLKVLSWKKSSQDMDFEPVAIIEIAYPATEQIKEMLKPFGI